MHDVACIGILVADVVAKPFDKLPEKGKLELINHLQLYTGGCATNSAIDMSRLGLDVAIIGKIGSDGFGKFLYQAIKEEGVDVEGLVFDKDENTSASIVSVDSNGERSFLHCLGANARFKKEDINDKIINRSKIVFIAGTMLLPSFDGEPCAQFLQKAQKMGKITVLDTAWDSTGRWMQLLQPCLRYLDVFIPSYEEAVQLSNQTLPEKIADSFLDRGVKTAVIKLGSEGCFIKDNKGEKHLIPPSKQIKPVDTTGAGDSFVAGFLTGMIKGWDLYKCGRFANQVGIFCILSVGASTGIKDFKTILESLEGEHHA